ncbi:Transposon Ty3-G Gag-Pol polyprotein [Vitis vinifera]|uniref:Transposon Ty3-G Gag-Pol polyprotein n=1 Tax=Vitis vinifera TaxID=29760 RepID=A0A438HSX3_VITVI|nr:Transposon Ty3-G Gag-Pol polyprotein [Vitis vinifera]
MQCHHPGGIHHIDFVEDDSIHMMSWDDGLPEPIVLDDGYEVDTVGSQSFTPFSLISDWIPFELTPIAPPTTARQGPPAPFILRLDDDDLEGRDVQIVTRSGRVAQPPPLVSRPFDGAVSHEEVRREDDEILRQLQNPRRDHHYLGGVDSHDDSDRATCIVFSDDDLPPEGSDHTCPLYITVGCSGHRVPSVLLDNGSALNVCPLATAIALGYAPSDFGTSTQTVRAYDSTKREVMGTLMIELMIGPTTFPILFQVITVRSTRDIFAASEPVLQISHSEDDLLLTRFTFDEIQTLEIEDFCRDFVAMSFNQHNSIVGPSEFIAAIDHDTTFELGFIPTEADYRHMGGLRKERRIRGSETRPRLEEIDSVVHTDRETDLQHLFHQLQLSDGAPDSLFPLTITPTSPDRASMLSLCFPEEITGDGLMVDSTEMIDGVVSHDEYRDEMDMMTMSQITSIVQLQPVSAFDMFGVSTIEVFEGTLPVPELPEDDSSLFEGIVSPVEGASDLGDPPLSFDVLSGFVSRSDDVSVASFMDLSIFEYSPASFDCTSISAPHSPTSQIFDINDEVAWPDLDRDSSDHNSDPVDKRVSPATGDVETVDFGTEDHPRELKIGSPLSTDERDRLIHLLRSYLDVFAWSYEDMLGLDPSIVQHHLPILPHVRPVKQKLRRLHPRWSLQVKEEIQKQLNVGFISVVEYPEWLANVVPVPKKDGKVRVCVDFRDLNKASPKDDFPLPHIDLLVDSTAGHSMLSFMDGFSGNNQILMAPEDMEKTAFITEWGSPSALERFFERIRKFRLRLNAKKCTFGVTSGKLLGHMVSDRGIEVDPDKIKAILDMPVPRTEKEIRVF